MKNGKFYILLILILGIGGYTVYKINQQPKVAVVDFQQLVLEYDGMIEAMLVYEEKAKGWELQADSLQSILRAMVNDLETNEYEEKLILAKENNLRLMNNYMIQQNEEIMQLAQEEDAKLTGAVLNQVMSYIDTYAEDNGYDIIYGKNDGNYILHKSDEFDITEDVLKGLNATYNGE